MSMTREEAIKEQESLLAYWESGEAMVTKRAVDALRWSIEALYALRPVSRERVEKVWRGEWIKRHSAYDHKIFTCARCGKRISIQGENLNFCPKCGSAQTDEAVNILLKRLEVLKDGKID